MKKALWNWLVDFVQDWFVPREDYSYVQNRINSADNYIDQLQKDYVALMDSFYTRTFQTYEQYGESIKAEYIQNERVDLQGFDFGYRFHIPHMQFATLSDLTKVHKDMKSEVIARLTKAFEKHMQANLFRDL